MKTNVFMKSVAITAAIMLLVYRSLWAIVFFPVVFFFVAERMKQAEKERKNARFQEEFLHGIVVLNTSLQSGLSMENAWKEVEKETKLLYGTESEFYVAIKEMNQKVAHNTPVEKLFLEVAYKSQLEDIMQFAELLEFGKRTGSNWKKIINSTVSQMTERQEARMQIEVMVAEKKMEQQIMNIVPIGLLAFLQFSAWDYIQVLYHNWLGVMVMTAFLICYVISILLSEKILKVQL